MNYKTFLQHARPVAKRLVVWPWMGVLLITLLSCVVIGLIGVLAGAIIDDVSERLNYYSDWVDL